MAGQPWVQSNPVKSATQWVFLWVFQKERKNERKKGKRGRNPPRSAWRETWLKVSARQAVRLPQWLPGGAFAKVMSVCPSALQSQTCCCLTPSEQISQAGTLAEWQKLRSGRGGVRGRKREKRGRGGERRKRRRREEGVYACLWGGENLSRCCF